MKTLTLKGLLLGLLLLVGGLAQADGLLMVRSTLAFPEALEALKKSVAEHGYKVAHVQTCDSGMDEFGYKSDFYQVVFFGKLEEVRRIADEYPDMIPFIPLKIAIFAENDETVLVSLDPMSLAAHAIRPELQVQLQRWKGDIMSIMREIGEGV